MYVTFHISTLILIGIGCFVLGIIVALPSRGTNGDPYGGGADGCA